MTLFCIKKSRQIFNIKKISRDTIAAFNVCFVYE